MVDRARDESGNRMDARDPWPAPVKAEEEPSLAEAAVLLRDHPCWAIWLPAGDRGWTAVRPASSRPPAAELPMIWIHAGTASELARRMDAMDEQVSGRGWIGHESGPGEPGR